MKKRLRTYFSLLLIFLAAAAAAFVCLPDGPYLKIGDKVIFKKEIRIKEGLDLKGGAHLVYSADMSKVEEGSRSDAASSLAKVIENRVNGFGITEPVVQTSKSGNDWRLLVELPGVQDLNEAMNLIGKTAELDFREGKEGAQDFVKTDLTGKDFKRADVGFDQGGSPLINIEFNAEGAKKFEEITARNVGKPLAIYLDNKLISAPNVNEKISGGKGQITGQFDIKEAKNLAIQLNAGALPVPIKMIEERNIGATLGQESVAKSIYAGIIGVIFVSLYMIVYYRGLGIFSTIGLSLYLLFTIALIKLFGVTITMGGIAGLILSVGMSMETDVLVFERIREELRAGRSFTAAIRLGFSRAWPSVRDSNAVSVIIAALLYTAGGTIRGFAVVLILGIVIGLATTFIGTRTLLAVAMQSRRLQRYGFFAVEKPKEAE